MGLEPMDSRPSNVSVFEPNGCETLELTPSTATETLLKERKNSDL